MQMETNPVAEQIRNTNKSNSNGQTEIRNSNSKPLLTDDRNVGRRIISKTKLMN